MTVSCMELCVHWAQLTRPIVRGSQSPIHKHPWAACGINSTGLAVGAALPLCGSQAPPQLYRWKEESGKQISETRSCAERRALG